MKQKEKIFLALTSLEEFWDKNKEIVFLGNWCNLIEGKIISQENKHISWKKDIGEFETAFDYVNETYEKLLIKLSKKMNNIHETTGSERFWRIIIGPWLYMYISVIYDRYRYLKKAIELYGDFDTMGIDCSNTYFIPRDTYDYALKIKEDDYNLQIFSQIMSKLGTPYECKKYDVKKIELEKSRKSFKSKLASLIYKQFRSKNKVFIKETYFSPKMELELFINSKGRIVPINEEYYVCDDKVDTVVRNVAKNKFTYLKHENEFFNLAEEMILENIPIVYLEGFKNLHIEVEKRYKNKYPKALFSATSMWFDEAYKLFSAYASKSGTIILGTQHGGNYGSEKYMNLNYHELKISDVFYSWGWKTEKFEATVIPMPSTKLSNREKINACNNKDGILYVSTIESKYLGAFYGLNNESIQNSYLNWGLEIFRNIKSEIRNKIILRSHRENLGWNYKERVSLEFPEIEIQTWEKPFIESLQEVKLYVCDHLSTTFLEALSMNKPTILIWDKNIYKLFENVEEDYKKLQEIGILFFDKNLGAKEIEKAYEDIELWWTKEKQKIVEEFCLKYALNSEKAQEIWGSELEKYIKIKKGIR